MDLLVRMDCLNCGVRGHTYRECRLPVMSYGVLAIQVISKELAPTVDAPVEKEPRYLLIRRKDSLSYVEFMRGKYALTNHAYIQLLCNEMTTEERRRLLTLSFSEQWHTLWSGQRTRQFRNESDAAQAVFDAFRASGDSNGRSLASYVEACTHHYDEPEWGFPKGRRNIHETDIRCAVREWTEETGLPSEALHILPVPPCEEAYTGSNGIPYKQIYYLGTCATSTTVDLSPENPVMTREIGGIRWCSVEEALALLRRTNPVKRELLQQIHRRVTVGDLRYLLA